MAEMDEQEHDEMAESGEIIIKLRGCPFRVTEAEIMSFLAKGGCNVIPGTVVIQAGADGRPSGAAYVKVPSEEDAQAALAMQRQCMGSRFIELYRETHIEEVAQVTSAPQNRGSGMNSIGNIPVIAGDVVVRLRGLPFAATELDIANFFSGVNIAQQGIHLVFNHDNRPSGEAFVELEAPSDLEHALRKDRQMLGHRYVEVFRSSRQEMEGGGPQISEPLWGNKNRMFGAGGYRHGSAGDIARGSYGIVNLQSIVKPGVLAIQDGPGGKLAITAGPKDWKCPSCKFKNFAGKSTCKQCNTPMPSASA
eukprot:TRINITY_DN385_c0_g2_i1.p1 TRINITY_DN385_c0_g2~~TRINITY_DN385_c0_g2_i1.p1  ORF type:complete len:307 (+),score=97.67 TRINITY_DN385_c0_g2_i1:100-1020(+)